MKIIGLLLKTKKEITHKILSRLNISYRQINIKNIFSKNLSKLDLISELKNYGIEIEESNKIKYSSKFTPLHLDVDITYVRHGETNINSINGFQGRCNITNPNGTGINDINANGIKHGIHSYKSLKNKSFDVIMNSPLKRAKDTDRVYAFMSGNMNQRIIADGLTEISFGSWETKTIEDISEIDYEDAQHATAYRKGDLFIKSKNGGESFAELLLRAAKLINYLNTEYKGKKVLIFAHGTLGNAIRIIRHSIHENKDNGYVYWRAPENTLKNGEVIKIK